MTCDACRPPLHLCEDHDETALVAYLAGVDRETAERLGLGPDATVTS